MNLTKFLTAYVEILVTILVVLLLFAFKDEVSKKVVKFVHDVMRDDIIIPDNTSNKRTYEYKTVKETDNFSPNNINEIKDIYYTVLNNGWNNFTFYCPFEYENCVNDTLSIANKSDYIELLNFYVSPFNNYTTYNTTVASNGEIYFKIIKIYTDEEIEFLNKYIDNVLEELQINTEKPTKEDLKKIHDYIIKNVTYDDEYNKEDPISDSNNAYGAVKERKAICSGYTDLYALFLDRLNIKNIKLPSEEHIWNYVYFEDKWYHIDLTWDDD